ncbi:MAG: anhydro-N-acetylmuramic acid kinase [Flavobacterium sp.]|nr:anhydro-N-acetylmuramic acid kinase [Flavobacterium sp.]
MFKQSYSTVGVMSGTSLDGIDLAHVIFSLLDGNWRFELIECETIPYPEDWLNKLKIAYSFNENELTQINNDYTIYLGETITSFITRHNLKKIDAVCSHGHTILHQPENKITLQIGNLPRLSQLIDQIVVCDFRIQDVLLGGQGAPLVPIGDQILFLEYDYCLNLGGFSNISFNNEDGIRIAFDISPVNTILNFYANKLGLDYDNKGLIAKSGKVNQNLLKQLNELEFYSKQHPKSLGFEFVKETVLPLIENHYIEIEDKLATFTEHIAFQIANAVPNKSGKLLTTGGGAYNDFLIDKLKFYLPEINVVVPSNKILEYKEALIFALLGVLRLRNETNVLSSVTGSCKDHCSGYIYKNE